MKAIAIALGLLVALASPEVRACGGLFCNPPPSPTDPPPVAQTGENVLFAVDPVVDGASNMEAHIQIFYTGPADRFSWVVPVDGFPTLDVGSDRVFAVLDAGTRPRFTFTLHDEGVCKDDRSTFGVGSSGSAKKNDSGSAQAGDPADDGVTVAFRGSVGPFDAAVIKANDPAALKAWLTDNRYFVSEKADKLIDAYVLEGKSFVALKLLSGKDVKEIQPIVLRFSGPGPCVPLRLTAIAATDDLKVNLWVLSRARVVPSNYLEMKLNEARIDWFQQGRNYEALLKEAADDAGGNAFAAEYVGPSSMLQPMLLPAGGYPLDTLRKAPSPPEAVAEVIRIRLPFDDTLLGILERHIPLPQSLKDRGVQPRVFYAQFRSFWPTISQGYPRLDAAALAKEIDAAIVQPLVRAEALFGRYPKLTRLATFISPSEMNVDPVFVENPTLPDIPTERHADGYRACGARAYNRCEAPIRIELPDGKRVWFKAPAEGGWCDAPSVGYDRDAVDQTPALAIAWQRDQSGDGVVRMDNSSKIASGIDDQNDSVIPGCSCTIGSRSSTGMAPFGAALAVAAFVLVRRRRRR